ncbi:hypothetical protein [Kineococcus sp. SYSU DK005]|uniref:hypothetical protein n=1 Tax=Kineococcus sp. SYSU DK005 TaxID=3383126 RepID=UPI003D7ED499
MLNVDGRPLEADHTLARSLGGGLADRLLIATCNASRGAGRASTRTAAASDERRPYWSREW